MAEHTLSFNLRANPQIKADFETAKRCIEIDLGVEITNSQTLGMVLNFYKQSRDCWPPE